MEAKVTGTATFNKVDVEPLGDEDTVEVTGYYIAEETSVTTYRGSPVYIDGMKVGTTGGQLTLHGDEWIYVHSTGDELFISSSKPDDLGQ